jgi:hypothetical protein
MYKVVAYMDGVPTHLSFTTAQATLAALRSAQQKGQHAEVYTADGEAVWLDRLQREASEEARKV